jgi:hypothetical protein
LRTVLGEQSFFDRKSKRLSRIESAGVTALWRHKTTFGEPAFMLEVNLASDGY